LQGKHGLVARDSRPLLVFFGAAHSGPARRMESLVAHLARKERMRLRVAQVDVDEQPQVAERFRVTTVPTLALVKDKRVVGRLEGRVSAPRIERMLAPHLPDELAAA
jgi:thioredoxin-like negative regulator of GroEL